MDCNSRLVDDFIVVVYLSVSKTHQCRLHKEAWTWLSHSAFWSCYNRKKPTKKESSGHEKHFDRRLVSSLFFFFEKAKLAICFLTSPPMKAKGYQKYIGLIPNCWSCSIEKETKMSHQYSSHCNVNAICK